MGEKEIAITSIISEQEKKTTHLKEMDKKDFFRFLLSA